jgi:hypothetical protein
VTAPARARLEVERVRKVGDHAAELDFRMRGREPRQRRLDRRRRDVHRDEAARLQRGQPGLALGAIARAQVDELPPPAGDRCDRLAMHRKDRALGAGQIVLGKLADRLEKRVPSAS